MNKILRQLTLGCLVILISGCAAYQAVSLAALDPDQVRTYPEAKGLRVGYKVYSEKDCFDYLDRNVLAKGYQPVQLTLENQSERTYLFSVSNVRLPCADPKQVAKLVRTSTVGRVLGYGLGGLLIGISSGGAYAALCAVPAVVDGIKSANANARLERDFAKKANPAFHLPPGGYVKTLLFIPKAQFSPSFEMVLLDEQTKAPVVLTVSEKTIEQSPSFAR